MAARKLLRDLLISEHPLRRRLLVTAAQVSHSSTRLQLAAVNANTSYRQFGVLNDFSKKIRGEVNRNEEFQQSVKEFKEKAEELKLAKDDLKVRTKQKTEELYKHVDGAWTEAATKVSATLKERVSTAKDEVKETFGIGRQGSSESSSTSTNKGSETHGSGKSASGTDDHHQFGANDTSQTMFNRFRSGVSSMFPKVSLPFRKLKDAKLTDLAKKSFVIVKDELNGNPSKRKRIKNAASRGSPSNVERSTRTDVAVIPIKQSHFSKQWEAFREKMQEHPIFKRVSGFSEPVVAKSQEIAEDMRERWETSDNPVVHKIQDINESVFGETATAMSVKEIRRRDPYFSLPDFASEVQEVIKPVLNAYLKGDAEVLKKYCGSGLVDRCIAEHRAYESQGIFFDNKILHISEVEVRETKMMGDTPLIIVGFQTQQVYCVRDRLGSITEGGKDTIHAVHYLWAMEQVNVDELGEGAQFPIWKLREMQQIGIRALI